MREAQPAGVEAGEIEEVRREPGQAVDLLAHAHQELEPGRLVELGVVEQLEEAAEREERRAQLVRRVRDELAAGAVERRETQPHPLEGPGQLSELVAPVVDDGHVEVAHRNPLGRQLEPPDPPGEEPGPAEAEEKSERGGNRAGDEDPAADDAH